MVISNQMVVDILMEQMEAMVIDIPTEAVIIIRQMVTTILLMNMIVKMMTVMKRKIAAM